MGRALTREHPHPDYHAEALALASRGMRNQSQGVKFLESGDSAWLRESAIAISWALADAAQRSYRAGRRNAGRIETVRQYERVRQAVQALPTLGMPENVEARTAILDLLGGMIRRSCDARLVGDQWTTEKKK